MQFQLKSPYVPTGDQPQAIKELVEHLRTGVNHQTLLGVTGSGKTFTMANVIQHAQKPTLVISPNKTLAAQLYQEFRSFFPENAVHYFVSYYDYYQPEAYIPQSDTYIEKDAKINQLIDSLRHASTASLLSRRDCIIVASVSCIYGVGSPEEYEGASLELRVRQRTTQKDLRQHLVRLQYAHNALDPRQGNFRVRENTVEVYLPSGEEVININLKKNTVTSIIRRPINMTLPSRALCDTVRIFPAKHFVTPQNKLDLAIANIKSELEQQLHILKQNDKPLEAARLKQRTQFDLEMLTSTGYVNGIENYSRHLEFRAPRTPPHTLIDYFRYAYGDEFLIFIDESHVTVPQLRGMERGDHARKQVLINYGFRLPSALDNRPLTFEEFNKKIKQVVFVSATPAPYEIKKSHPHIVEQIIRPTGILDPKIKVKPTRHQINDVIKEVAKRVIKKERALVMALTKRLAEDIAQYLDDAGLRATYLHAEVKTLKRPEILQQLRTGDYDVLVGINLLREGIDLPEVSFIAILDADKEGFLRNHTTLLQIIGRAARHTQGSVILYADTVTASMKSAMQETARRRILQETYNRRNGIIPRHIKKEISAPLFQELTDDNNPPSPQDTSKEVLNALKLQMKQAARSLDFERAAMLRDRIKKIHAV